MLLLPVMSWLPTANAYGRKVIFLTALGSERAL